MSDLEIEDDYIVICKARLTMKQQTNIKKIFDKKKKERNSEKIIITSKFVHTTLNTFINTYYFYFKLPHVAPPPPAPLLNIIGGSKFLTFKYSLLLIENI